MAGVVACGQPARQGPQEQACGLQWQARAGDVSPEVVRREGLRLGARLGLHPLLGQVLWSRNLRDPAQALSFLRSDSVPDPWRLEGIPQAAWRIWRAVRRGERVVVYGDYDADGQTAAAIMVRLLRRLGAQVEFFIPHRLSLGYGLHEEVLLEMARAGVKLVVAVDCGLSAAQAVQEAARAGLEVVVIDHHEPPEKLPEAAAVVAAHQLKGWPAVDQMSAAGLAFHTARALLDLAGLGSPLHEELVQLAAVGTVADVVALVGENRRLVRLGLEALRRNPLPGLQALASAASLDLSAVESRHVAFVLAPRLNAAGRVDDAVVGLRLLLSEDPHEARQLAARLDQANRARQRTEQEVLEQAAEQVARRLAACDDPVAVAVGEGWHPGVIGIVASRLVERFGRPAVVVSLEDDQARGSARSVEGVDIHRLLSRCRPLLSRFGGHPMAAGFSLPRQRVHAFVEALLDAASRQLPALPAPRLFIDGWAQTADLGELLGRQLPLLEPYGEANPRPVLACLGVQVVEARAVGAEGQHLRLVLREPVSGEQRPAVAFDAAQRWGDGGWLREEGRLWDVAFHVRVGPFNPCELQVVDLRPSCRDARAVVRLRGLREDDWAAAAQPAAAGVAEPTGARGATGSPAAACPPSVQDLRGLAEQGVEALGRWLEQAGPPPGTAVWVAVGDEGEGLRLAWEWWQSGLARQWPVAWHRPDLP
ncbi:MAG TPA: single-stranded-DNA-specific exonuclease RecJ, partial [Limnochordales bacterium]